jgi:hypothetical protein
MTTVKGITNRKERKKRQRNEVRLIGVGEGLKE